MIRKNDAVTVNGRCGVVRKVYKKFGAVDVVIDGRVTMFNLADVKPVQS